MKNTTAKVAGALRVPSASSTLLLSLQSKTNSTRHSKNVRYLRCAAFLVALLIFLSLSTSFGADVPAPPDRRVPRVHIIHGLWDSYYQLDRALAQAGVPLISDSWHWMGWGFGAIGTWDQHPACGIDGFPDAQALASADLIIVCNINGDALAEPRRTALKNYVEHGGSILFLGGRFAFGGQYANNALEEIAPVTFEKGIDLVQQPAELIMAPAPDTDAEPWIRNQPWEVQPHVYWHHRVKPKPGARVLINAGAEPLLIVGTFGKGRVALFAGSVLSNPPAGQTPFWTWAGWPGVMSGTIQWLTSSHPRDPDPDTATLRAELAKAMEQDADGLPLAQFSDKVDALARHCHDQATADFLVHLLTNSQGDLPAPQIPTLVASLRLFAGPNWAAQAKSLVASGLQGKTAVGLRLLGAAKTPDALSTLTWFYTNAKVRSASGSPKSDDMALPAPGPAGASGADAVAPVDPNVIRLGALEGIGSLGDASAITLLRQALITHQNGKVTSSKEQSLDALMPEHKLYEEALISAVRCGHPDAVDPLFDAMLGNMNIVVRAKMEKNKTDVALKRVEEAVGQAIAWEREMEERLLNLPEPVQILIARKVGASGDRRVIRIASAAFAGHAISAEVKAELLKSKFPAIVDLAGK